MSRIYSTSFFDIPLSELDFLSLLVDGLVLSLGFISGMEDPHSLHPVSHLWVWVEACVVGLGLGLKWMWGDVGSGLLGEYGGRGVVGTLIGACIGVGL